MIFRKETRDPVDHAVDLATLHEMEEMLPMTAQERKILRIWVYTGHDPERNPWHLMDNNAWELNFLEAYRRYHGYKLKYRFVTID